MEEGDDQDDMEYNYLADQPQEEENEEFRNDRAVRIPRQSHSFYMFHQM